MEVSEFLIAAIAMIVIFVPIPLIIFLIIRNIMSNQHKERMAMIQQGINPNCSMKGQSPSAGSAAEGQKTPGAPGEPFYPAVKEDKIVKWMFILGGLAVGLIISSIVKYILFTYTLIETRGLGFAICVLCVCAGLYIYYVHRNKRRQEYYQTLRELNKEKEKEI